jgi:hypothetical protein
MYIRLLTVQTACVDECVLVGPITQDKWKIHLQTQATQVSMLRPLMLDKYKNMVYGACLP